MPKKLCDRLHDYTSENNITPFIQLLSVFILYLHRVVGKNEITIGIPVLNRSGWREKATMGMFISTVPFRIKIDAEKSFDEFSITVEEAWSKALRHQRYPQEEVLHHIRKNTGNADGQLYDIVFSYQNARFEHDENSGRLSSRWHFCGHQRESLSVHFNDRDKKGQLVVNYDFLTDVHHSTEINIMNGQYVTLLSHALDDPTCKLKNFQLLSENERQIILKKFNDTKVDFPREVSMLYFFENSVEAMGDAVAVFSGKEQLSYAELNTRAEQLACVLRSYGTVPGSIVGLLLHRSFEMMTAILAVWKAGGAYMPIDPACPGERMLYILDDSGANLVISTSAISVPDGFTGIKIDLDKPLQEHSIPEAAITQVTKPDDVAYVIYTSGTTGKPKGVLIEHRALVNRIHWMNRQYPMGNEGVILQKTPYTFDVSVWELTWWFYAGVKMAFLAPGDEKFPDRIAEAIEYYRVTVMHFVPSMLGGFMEYLSKSGKSYQLHSLRRVFSSGEALMPKHANSFYSLVYPIGGARLHNLYGPTEAAIDVSYYDCPISTTETVIPIGKPIDNIRLYVLDRYGNLQPIGMPGELYIGGVGLARGYLNKPDLSAEKFIETTSLPEKRLYRTGDLARWYPKGDISYLGRIDHQVKIRGFRIELGDIQHHMETHPKVHSAVITVSSVESGDSFLTGYYVADSEIPVPELREHLEKSLPEYMIPSRFMQLNEMPLSNNGKVDRAKLPTLDASPSLSEKRVPIPPRNARERLVAEIWSSILNQPLGDISITDNFFEIGGDSIRAINMVCQMPGQVQLNKIYEHPTLEDFALHYEESEDKHWLTALFRDSSPKTTYVLCPYGGGSAYIYLDLAARLRDVDPECSVFAVSLPGHDFSRDKEEDGEQYLEIRDIATLIFREMAELEGTVVLYAHCVGSALGVELARLSELSGKPVKSLILGGILPSKNVRYYGQYFDPWKFFNNKKLLNYLSTLGMSTGSIDDSGSQSMLDAFRHDVRAYYKYFSWYTKQKTKLSTPVFTILGDRDTMTKGKDSTAWSVVSENNQRVQVLNEAGHYFTQTHSMELANLMCQQNRSENEGF